jgi:cell division protein ZapA
MDETTTLGIRVLDKEYQVSCRQDEVDALGASARLLDQQMRQIRESGKVFGLDRIAVMAALNLCNELLKARAQLDGQKSEAGSSVRRLTDRVTSALAEHKQLKL